MTVFKDYPYWGAETPDDVERQLRQICNIRKDDITTIQNLPQIFMSGRKVGKVPSASNDVAATDRVGDINYDASYLYILVDNGGTPAWRRATLGAW